VVAQARRIERPAHARKPIPGNSDLVGRLYG
jgi:hypothetical protein